MKSYQERKAEARDKCIDIQSWLAVNAVSWGELAEIQDYLEKVGKRYGLLTELRENGLL